MSSDDKLKNSNIDNSDYKSVKAITPKTKPTEVNKPSWLGRKYLKMKKAAKEFWVVGKYGFQLGGAAGLILGFLVGGFEALRMKSIWPLPIAMLGSGITFGSIFAISTVLRSDDQQTKVKFEIVYYDKNLDKYVRMKTPLFKYTEHNSRI
jgi:hypothetical protein